MNGIFVKNEPVVMCCGKANAKCTCGNHNTNNGKPTHEQLGIPVLNFRKPTADKPKQQPAYQRGPGIVTNGTKPTHEPLGIPVMNFSRKKS